MAHTKAKGSTRNNRDSQSKRLGVKVYGGEAIRRGGIILRQRGSKYYVSAGAAVSGDDSIYATCDGHVVFSSKKVKKFDGRFVSKTFVGVKVKEEAK
ncbi:hypothetical protein A3A71_00985 [Candidatus Berkelbacteria bacterium RIFCSPLOWO2_01_FULL_50_28]|uniref:Large ribosomal subunit protein bL27 n=1 Tax=Candidatus Berkelbacteria bacterium RIFCSPLOWO2_01_FULL_50_28 TaxID=1797471 RepID=A0A1F5EB55_9BACT|nr:MAG: hypothetical protein A2807_01555 [Candidatus Berkelbacteria bacterium RIFCSPHIGHO2_01_FULL_50_36]OGD62783.1 MAG: hypothetical protein A3F39_03790 [Candidatus Berkelbacteria bacterium RIFCSPHIGHO2_12_FULL_50_11]OGD64615.1 MAG: hypothetical protein A3A71_00985 [Candidatus Berkelbacteria bacterium RIFCSPLOWO2_01_FULL_50_28]